ncbi:MAG: response regulator [Chloroflexota bacterium]|nr:response regulator [Dehalococcoidia bacterium]MDW8253139.1 response regulator [Chloroflexota bacterium]
MPRSVSLGSAGRRRILLADDHASIRQLVAATLGGDQFDLSYAANGREALDLALREHPDLVLLDINMPLLDGFEVCRALKRRSATEDIKVVFLSALDSEEDRRRGLAAGADGYIVKPFSPLFLLNSVQQLLDEKRAAEASVDSVAQRAFTPLEFVTATLAHGPSAAPLSSSLEARVTELEWSQQQLLIYADELNKAYRELQTTYFATLQALAAAIDARDPYTFGHSRRVSYYSVEIAKLMGLDPSAIEVIRRAALLHDIGKIAVSDATLRKPGPLTAAEWAEMKRHPEVGEQLIAGLAFLRESAPLIRCHHEWWDGRGYPDGLRHEEIPLGARILSVADAFDAMTSTRPYRPALSVEEARAEAHRGRHRQFDSRVVDAFEDGIAAIEAILRQERPSA